MIDADFYLDFMAWREQILLDPDASLEAYQHHLDCELALETLNQKETA